MSCHLFSTQPSKLITSSKYSIVKISSIAYQCIATFVEIKMIIQELLYLYRFPQCMEGHGYNGKTYSP